MQLSLCGDVGARDLVSDHVAAVVGEQLVDETVLHRVGIAGGLRADGFRKLGKAFVVDSGLGERVGCGTHLNMLTIANSCGPGSALLEPEARSAPRQKRSPDDQRTARKRQP